MSDFFDEITSDEIAEFRGVFEKFATSGLSEEEPESRILPETEKRLLDLLIESGSSSEEEFRSKVIDLLEKVSEIDVLGSPGHTATATPLLEQAMKYKKEILGYLEKTQSDGSRKLLWRNHINDFFDKFTTETIKRWESIEEEQHQVEIDELEKSRRILSQENSYLRGIYSLSLQIASIPSTFKIFDYLASKLALILHFDFLIVLDTSEKKPLEYIFHSEGTTIKDIEVAKRRIEDVFELFHRTVMDRDNIEVVIQDPSTLKTARFAKSDPESVIVPMIDEETTWGMIGIFRRSGVPFTPQEVQAVSIVTSLVDLVARNQRTLQRERTLVRSLDEQILFARKVQESMLPTDYTDTNFIICSRFKPSTTLSGDFYQYFRTAQNERGVIIGDVTGHDIAAAMMMMTVMGVFSDVFSLPETSIEEMISRANSRLHETISEQFFVTAMVVWMDTEGRYNYINLGHPSGLLSNINNGQIIELQPTGFPLGIFDEIELDPRQIDFKPGDKIILYTDGLTEVKNESGRAFGLEKLKSIFSDIAKTDNQSILDKIIDSVNSYSGSNGIGDDIAILIMENQDQQNKRSS